MRTIRVILASILAAPLALGIRPIQAQAAQEAPAAAALNSEESVPTIHTNARLVMLDVVVTDANGNPAHGLKPSDFTLTEDGVPQKFASFNEHVALGDTVSTSSLPPNTFTVQPPPPEDETKTVIVLADTTALPAWNSDTPAFPNGQAVNTGYVRKDLAAFFETAPSNQPIAIFRMDWQGLHLVQGLTTDRNLLLQAIASKRMLPPLGFRVAFTPGPYNTAQQLVSYVRSISGRVNLVYITYGAMGPIRDDRREFPDLTSVVNDLNGPSDVLRLSRVALSVISLTEADPFGNATLRERASSASGHVYFSGVRESLAEIAAAGSDYYTISYVPTNPFWNAAFRRIRIKVAGYPQPLPPRTGWSSFWWQALGWAQEQKSNVLYRSGYFATPEPYPSGASSVSSHVSTRRRISYSPKGDPDGDGEATASPLSRAMAFGSLPPDRISFTIVATPSPDTQKLKIGQHLSKDNFLTEPFQRAAFRNVRIHYWIDPQSLHMVRASDGSYTDYLQFVTVVYRDDGLQANGLSSTWQIHLSENGLEDVQNSGVSFDQTIAVPVAGNPVPGNFWLRVAVNEKTSGNIGAIEISADQIKPANPAPTAAATTPAGQ